ncbi:hypothetical protein PTKIN_Ptkin06aG0019500 [Pterospermum kingtungense]
MAMATIEATFLIILCLIFSPMPGGSQGLPRFNNNTEQESLLAFKSQISHDRLGVLRTWNLNYPSATGQGSLVMSPNRELQVSTLKTLVLLVPLLLTLATSLFSTTSTFKTTVFLGTFLEKSAGFFV